MSGTADPWEPACMPAFRWTAQVTPTVERTGGPERVYDAAAAKEPLPPRGPLGFAPPLPTRYDSTGLIAYEAITTEHVERDPLLWEGDGA